MNAVFLHWIGLLLIHYKLSKTSTMEDLFVFHVSYVLYILGIGEGTQILITWLKQDGLL